MGRFHGLTPFDLFHSILTDSKAETLLKAKQYGLLEYFMFNTYRRDKIWPLAKICIRNGYVVKDVSMWIDYLDLLAEQVPDLRNPYYVCPANLRKEHDRLLAIENRRQEREQERQEREWEEEILVRAKRQNELIEETNTLYRKMKERFLDIEFGDGLIRVCCLQSLQEFKEEGDSLRHCVFTNEYYLRENSLILSARIEGRPIETIEVALDRLSVIQCRGECNMDSEYHDRIVRLVEKNMNVIRKKNIA